VIRTFDRRELGAVPTVVTFRTHPKLLLLGRAPRTLTTLEHRLELFARAGIGLTVALEFDEALRDLSAEAFVEEVAVRGLGVRRFVLGFDSKFGHNRQGTPEYVRRLGFEVEIVPKVVVRGRPVSSTAIREAVELGDLEGAAAMLGRPVTVFGRVVRGAQRGRGIGFPTANLDLHHELHPPTGVYACRVRVLEGPFADRLFDGVGNIGFRPTVEVRAPKSPQVEVHLFGFEGDLYGANVELEFVQRLRGERRFDGMDALAEQIRADVTQARAVLAASPA
jgi:riboflavin kinase/FMN adenylyltransferase